MSLGKKEPAKKFDKKTPPEPVAPKKDKNKYKTAADYDKAYKAWEQEHKDWTAKYGNKKEEPKKEEPKKKEDKKTTKPPIKTAKDYTAKVKIAKGKAPMTGRISKMHGKSVMNIARGKSDFPSLHEETFASMFTAKFKNKLS
tara:strand:- start:337 stop:762 length:426 start_codon:yes stop_codon:yes gene_type:complete